MKNMKYVETLNIRHNYFSMKIPSEWRHFYSDIF